MISFANLTTKMKALYGTIGAIIGAAAVGVGTMFIGGSDAYLNTIPKDAQIVMKMNVGDLAEGVGINTDAGKKLMEKMMEAGGQSANESKLFKRIKEDPASLGLRLDKPAYIFFDLENKWGGCVVEMYSQDNLKETVKMLAEETKENLDIVERDGMQWVGENKDESVAMAFDSNQLIFAVTGGDIPAKQKLMKWKDQSSSDRYCETERWKKLQSVEGQMALDMNYGAIPNMNDADRMMREMYGISMKDINLIFGMNVQKGEASISALYYSDNKNYQEKIEKSMACMSNIDGKYAEAVPEDYVCWMGCNLHGQTILELLKDIEVVNKAITEAEQNAGIKVADFFNDLDGDMSFCLTSSVQGELQIPTMHFNTQVKNENYLRNVLGVIKSHNPSIDQLVSEQGSNFVINNPAGGSPLASMGVKGQDLFITNANAPLSGSTSALADYMGDIKKSTAFFVLNIPNMAKLISKYPMNDVPQIGYLKDFLSQFAVIFAYTQTEGSAQKSVMTLKFKNSEDYVVNICSTLFDKYMSMMNSSMSAEEEEPIDDVYYDDVASVMQ